MSEKPHNPDRPRRPKSLWEIMSHGKDPVPAPDAAKTPPPEPAEPPAPLKSLWKLMGVQPAETHPESSLKETTETPLRDQDTSKFDHIVDDALEHEERESLSQRRPAQPKPHSEPKRWRPPAREEHPLGIEIRKPKRQTVDSVMSRKAKTSVWLGISAITLSALALVPGMWTKFPALIVGFVALFCGFLAADEVRTSRGRVLGLNHALTGMGLSIVGMLLGPLLSWTLGDLSIFQCNRRISETRLESIGAAINGYYDRRRQFPAGGTFVKQPDGTERPMHGWMTTLLPYLGYDRLHESIDLAQPFDAAVNAGEMQRQIPEYLVAGIEQKTSIKEFAAAHFAGVGGEEIDARGDKVHFGVFDKNSTVFQQDVSDGLSSTFLAGQIPGNYPAWGEPSNWRHITNGLNRDQRGFGSPGGGPTLFLMADGSVRTLAADTDLNVLRSMCTRDAAD